MPETQQDILDDVNNIAEALCQWFRGQDIPPGRGISAMCTLIAVMCTVDEPDTVQAMQKANAACNVIKGITAKNIIKRALGED